MSHILFMSSDPILKEKNMEIFRQNGLEATGTSECLQGLVMLDKTEYDVIIIDDELADVNGYEACLKVRQQSDTPIVLLGSVSESDVWSKVEELGFDLYLRKPVGPKELLARIKALLRRPVIEKKPKSKESPAGQDTVTANLPKSQSPVEARQSSTAAPSSIVAEINETTTQPVSQKPVQPPPLQEQTHVEPPVQPMASPQSSIISDTPSAGQPQPLPPIRQAPPPIVEEPIQVAPAEPAPTAVPPLAGISPRQQDVSSARQQLQLHPDMAAKAVPEATGGSVLDDGRTIKLVDALVSGRLADINPTVDFNLQEGYSYPAVESLLDTSTRESIDILETLANNGILIKQPFEKFYADPEGLFQLVPSEHCPNDDSSNIIKGQLVEHFSCGYVGLDRDYKQDSRYICPKCRKDLRLIGTDYRNVGIHYRCQDCNEVFTSPTIKWRNLKTRRVWNADELREVVVYSYRFSPDKKGWLEFQLKPKMQLVDFLRLQGYQVQEMAQVTGESGAQHNLDILASRDDILAKINLGIGILVAAAGTAEVGLESLFRFDTRAYDIGINYKVVIAIPKLSKEAMKFAGRQMIRTYEARDFSALVSDITALPRTKISLQSSLGASKPVEGGWASGNTRAVVLAFLRNRGYEVFERALIVGKSGIEHTFDIYARRDDRIVVPVIAACVVDSQRGLPLGLDEIAMFEAACFDSGIRNKVFIGFPGLSEQARQFALYHKIIIIEQQDLGKLT